MSFAGLAKIPHPPYYAVIFTSRRTEGDNGYSQMADRMDVLAAQQPGFLGVESVRSADGIGITVSTGKARKLSVTGRNVEYKVATRVSSRPYQSYIVRVIKLNVIMANNLWMYN
jgi:hypothetical protein